MKKRYIVLSSGKRIYWPQGQDFAQVEHKVGKEDFEVFYAKNVQDLKNKIKYSSLLETFTDQNPGIFELPSSVIIEGLQEFLRTH